MVAFFLFFRVQFSQRSTWRFFLCQVNVIICFEFRVNNICYHAIPLSLVSVSGRRILGDPGAVSGEKSKNGRKKIRAKKSQEREEEPLGTMF